MDDKLTLDKSSDAEETKNIGLGWRTLVVVIALVVVGVLIYPLISRQLQSSGNDHNSSSTSPIPANIVGPEATAQANPDSADAQFELGNAYVQSGQWDQAVAAYQKAIELDPSYQAAYANLGVVYYQQEQLDLAASQYKKALELDSEDGDVAYNLGALYLQQALLSGDQPDTDLLDQAVEQLQQAMELAPDLAEPNFSLGVAYTAMNERTKAIEAFETFQALDSGQDPRASQEVERYLQMLRVE